MRRWSGRQIDLSCLSSGLKCRMCLCQLSSFFAAGTDPRLTHDSSHWYHLTSEEDSQRLLKFIGKRRMHLSPCLGRCSSEVVWTRKSNCRESRGSREKHRRWSMFLSMLRGLQVYLWKILASSSLRIGRGSRRPSSCWCTIGWTSCISVGCWWWRCQPPQSRTGSPVDEEGRLGWGPLTAKLLLHPISQQGWSKELLQLLSEWPCCRSYSRIESDQTWMKVSGSCCHSQSLRLSRRTRHLEACWSERAWQSRGRKWETGRGIVCYGPSSIAVSSLWQGIRLCLARSCLSEEDLHLLHMIPFFHALAVSNVSSCFVALQFYSRRNPSHECCFMNVQLILLASKMIGQHSANLLTWSTFLTRSYHLSLACCGAQSSALCHGGQLHLLTVAIKNCCLHELSPACTWPSFDSHGHPESDLTCYQLTISAFLIQRNSLVSLYLNQRRVDSPLDLVEARCCCARPVFWTRLRS